MRVKFLVAFALAIGAFFLPAPASRAEDATPQAFLESVYRTYEKTSDGVDIDSREKAARYFVPAIADLIGKDTEEAAKKKEIGRLDFDPFTGGQDWEPTKIAIKTEPGSSADAAKGEARFTFPGEKKETVVKLDLAKTAQGWRIADVRWDNEPESLAQILNAKE